MYIRKEFKGDINTLSTEDLNNIDFEALEHSEIVNITVETVKRFSIVSLTDFLKHAMGYGSLTPDRYDEDSYRADIAQAVIERGMEFELKINKHGVVSNADGIEIADLIKRFGWCMGNDSFIYDDCIEEVIEKYPDFFLKYFSLFDMDIVREIEPKAIMDAITNNTLVVFEAGDTREILYDIITEHKEFGVKLLGERGYQCTLEGESDEYMIVAKQALCRRLGFPYHKGKVSPKFLTENNACSGGRKVFKKVLAKIDSNAKSFTWDQMIDYILNSEHVPDEEWGCLDWLVEHVRT